ncbi:MAG: hypothetical protein JO179_13505, partial [Solirubrobacterales bacterium]|nr:hypothetical protein [Solirubrobacterales bacterium]
PEHAGPARRLALAGALVEVGSSEIMRRGLGEHAEAYDAQPSKALRLISAACLAAGSALVAARGRSSRAAAAAGGVLLAAGALSARWNVFKAGFASARDPRYVVGPQRRAVDEGRRQGAARKRSAIAAADVALGSPANSLRGSPAVSGG